ncbi:MAG TPA: ribosome small subunit-dependent GTPase A [Thermoanaerobaculia bacterium]|nr:ribosome small subunit-dependent GTPase A [Thermoanaerobaculia bacterium]
MVRTKKPDHTTRRHAMDLAKQRPLKELKLQREASLVRKAMRKGKGGVRAPKVTEDNWESGEQSAGISRDHGPSLESIVARLRERPDAPGVEYGEFDPEAGIVMSLARGLCRVFLKGEQLDCTVPAEIAVHQKSSLAVGDRVIVDIDEGINRLVSVQPRRTILARPDPRRKDVQRVIAANVDVVIHVVSFRSPPLRPRLIDRFLVAIQRGGAQPVICVNKSDLLDPGERVVELAKLDPIARLDVPIVACSTKTGEGMEQLRAVVDGKMSALVGHSGVGKSSVLNALDETLRLATNAVHKRGTGRHTTTASTLYDFGEGTYLIDTPGIREFGLWDLDRNSLRDYFPEFANAEEPCRFTDCSHVHEPDCEVKRLVESGEINHARYDTYLRLYEDLG